MLLHRHSHSNCDHSTCLGVAADLLHLKKHSACLRFKVLVCCSCFNDFFPCTNLRFGFLLSKLIHGQIPEDKQEEKSER